MGENVAFGMPLGVLGHATNCVEFRKVLNPAGSFQKAEAARRRHAFFRPFRPFFAHTFFGQFGKSAFDRASQFNRFAGGCEVEACCELHAAQDPQGVFRKGRAGVAQNLILQVRLAAKEIEEFVGPHIIHQRIDRVIAAGGSVARGEGGIERNFKAFVAGGGFGIAPGNAEIVGVGAGGEFHDSKGATDEIDAGPLAESGGQGIVVQAEDFDIEILVRNSEEPIPNAATDEIGPSEFGRLGEDFFQLGRKSHESIIKGALAEEAKRAIQLLQAAGRQRVECEDLKDLVFLAGGESYVRMSSEGAGPFRDS